MTSCVLLQIDNWSALAHSLTFRDFYIRSIFTFLYGFLFVLGIFGNGGVLWAVARNKRLQSARNVFLLNLIFTDLILVFTAIPVTPW